MSDTIFETIKERTGGESKSPSWYRRELRNVAASYKKNKRKLRMDEREDSFSDVKDSNELRRNVRKGHLYLFEYKAAKQGLKYFDRFPLVYVIGWEADSFIGANLHYINPKFRAKTISDLLQRQVLVAPKKTFHRYLFSNVNGRFLDLGEEEWKTSIYLPVDDFVTGHRSGKIVPYKKTEVWKETEKSQRDKFKVPRIIEDY